MTGSLWITVQNEQGSTNVCCPSEIRGANILNFSTGSQLIANNSLGQWNCGSCCVLDNNKGIMVRIRKVESEDKTKINILELERLGEIWRRKNVSPDEYYPNIHHQSGLQHTIKIEWEENGEKVLVDSITL